MSGCVTLFSGVTNPATPPKTTFFTMDARLFMLNVDKIPSEAARIASESAKRVQIPILVSKIGFDFGC